METLRQLFHRARPLVQHVGIEVGAIRPNQRAHLWVKTHLCKECWFAQHSVHFAVEHRLKIDDLFCQIIEANTQCVDVDLCKFDDIVEWMAHCLHLGPYARSSELTGVLRCMMEGVTKH